MIIHLFCLVMAAGAVVGLLLAVVRPPLPLKVTISSTCISFVDEHHLSVFLDNQLDAAVPCIGLPRLLAAAAVAGLMLAVVCLPMLLYLILLCMLSARQGSVHL